MSPVFKESVVVTLDGVFSSRAPLSFTGAITFYTGNKINGAMTKSFTLFLSHLVSVESKLSLDKLRFEMASFL